MVTVFLSILNQMEFHLVKNRKENCHHNHIPFDLKGNGCIVFSANALLHNVTMFHNVTGRQFPDNGPMLRNVIINHIARHFWNFYALSLQPSERLPLLHGIAGVQIRE